MGTGILLLLGHTKLPQGRKGPLLRAHPSGMRDTVGRGGVIEINGMQLAHVAIEIKWMVTLVA